MSEEDEALVERSHAEYKAARAAEAEAKAEEEEDARRRRLVNFPTRSTALMLVRRRYRACEPALDARLRRRSADRGARGAASREGGGNTRDRRGQGRGSRVRSRRRSASAAWRWPR